MPRNLVLLLCLLLALAGTAAAKDKGAKENAPQEKAAQEKTAQDKPADAKTLSGISIVGSDEAPKSLYFVPWKRSELGAETSLNKMLTESAVPVDREEFMRQLDLYEISTKK